MRRLAIYGSGGHAKVVADIVRLRGCHEVFGFVDDDSAKWGMTISGLTVVGDLDRLMGAVAGPGEMDVIVAVGDNAVRKVIAARVEERGFALATAIHPSAAVASGCEVGRGTVIMAQAAVNPCTRLGANVIVNTRAGIDHDCEIGDSVHIAPGATVCGDVHIGALTRIWAGATVINGIRIGVDATVGAGAVVLRDVPDGATVFGVPARLLRTKK